MPTTRTTLRSAVLAVIVLLAAACGGDDGGANPTATGTGDDGAGNDEPTDAPPSDAPAAGGGGSAIVTVDGVTMTFSMDEVEYSQIEGLNDLTFETCDPSFFGAGFHAIGYAVDSDGELILDDDGAIAGTLVLTFPLTAADQAATGPPELELAYESAGFDHDLVPIGQEGDLLPGSASTWTVGTTTIGGSVVLANLLSEAVMADFEVSCG
ncbi:MAG: hypothetical protein DHS20C19_12800 [Acidimicrobiales bacterium]|nr:MAG: hypothetical protein DHS20C19_12800 [Acidimicrobiales bacterium]